MEEYCQNPLCENEASKEVPVSVREASDQKRSLCAVCEESYSWGVQQGQMSQKGLLIEPPPKEQGPEPLWRVVYTIDVNAANAHKAAERAYEIMTDPQSLRPVLHILDGGGSETTVDLAEEPAPSPASAESSASREKALRFVQASGTQCPECGSGDLDFGTVEVEAQSAFQDACCQDCEARFYGVYRLVGYGLHHDGSCEVHTIDEDSGEIAGQSG